MRTEQDSLGKIKIPTKAYYGTTTARALKNFQISGETAPKSFKEALGIVKLAAAESNTDLKLLTKKQFGAIKKAANEFIKGKFDAEFVLDRYQAGAGTSYNMNSNEIIANRANEILGGKKGQYEHVHPNNHVNMAQSTNDVIPTATRIACLMELPALHKEITALSASLKKHADKHKKTVKVGRTHLQDAVPITLGQELDSYREALLKSESLITTTAKDLQVLGIGGTAVGTGINSHAKYKDKMIKNLSKITGIKFSKAKNATEIANNMNSFLNFSASLRSLATNLLNLSEDLKLMSTGPKAGLLELTLPPVQPGSSIMPGKINPSILECLDMICFEVIGNDQTISLCASRSHFELNVYCPLIMVKLVESIRILTNGIKMTNNLCIKGMKVNVENIEKSFKNSLATATALAPALGYALTSEIVKTALKKDISIEEEVRSRKLMPEKKLKALLSVEKMT